MTTFSPPAGGDADATPAPRDPPTRRMAARSRSGRRETTPAEGGAARRGPVPGPNAPRWREDCSRLRAILLPLASPVFSRFRRTCSGSGTAEPPSASCSRARCPTRRATWLQLGHAPAARPPPQTCFQVWPLGLEGAAWRGPLRGSVPRPSLIPMTGASTRPARSSEDRGNVRKSQPHLETTASAHPFRTLSRVRPRGRGGGLDRNRSHRGERKPSRACSVRPHFGMRLIRCDVRVARRANPPGRHRGKWAREHTQALGSRASYRSGRAHARMRNSSPCPSGCRSSERFR